MKYRKKPVVIEAIQFTGDNWREVKEFCSGFRQISFEPGTVYIEILEGIMAGHVGDYIVRGVKGEVYPVKPDIFAATYEEAPDGK